VVSASTAITRSVRTRSSAKLCATAFEPVFTGGRSTVTPKDSAISAVSSVEQSSTTTISLGSRVCRTSERRVSASVSASL
jgi:hypothetical protein